MSTIYAIRIAGYGASNSDDGGDVDPSDIATTPDNRTLMWRFASDLPASDSTGKVYVRALSRLPNELSWGVNLKSGESVTSNLSFDLDSTSTLMGYFLRSRVGKLANATAAVSASDTTLSVDATLAENSYVWWGQECIYIRSDDGGGDYTVARGQLGTVAVGHGVGVADDVEIFQADHGHTLQGRLVELVTIDGSQTGKVQDLENVIWRGVLDSVEWGGTEIRFACKDLLSIVRDGRVCEDLFRVKRIYGLPGYTDQPGEAYYGPAPGALVRAPYAGTTTAKTVFNCDDLAIICQLTRYLDNQNGSTSVHLAISGPAASVGFRRSRAPAEDGDFPDEMWEFFSCTEGAPSNTSTPSTNTLPLSSNPYILMLQLLTTTESGGNGAYDVGIETLGLGIPEDYIDVDAFLAFGGLYGEQLGRTELALAFDGEPVDVWPLFLSFLRPVNQTILQNREGKISIVAQQEIRTVTDIGGGFDDDDIPLDAPELEGKSQHYPLTSSITGTWHYPGQEEATVKVVASQVKGRLPKGYAEYEEMDLQGVADAQTARDLLVQIANQYSRPVGSVRVEAMMDKDLWPGEPLVVTLQDAPAPDGGMGMESELCTVIERSVDLESLSYRYTFLRSGGALQRAGAIHLAAEVASWDGTYNEATIAANAYIQDPHPQGWGSDYEAWRDTLQNLSLASIRVHILDETLAYKGYGYVDSYFFNGLAFSATPTATPVAGDIIIPAPYDESYGAPDGVLADYYAYQADSQGNISNGSTDDPGYRWTL